MQSINDYINIQCTCLLYIYAVTVQCHTHTVTVLIEQICFYVIMYNNNILDNLTIVLVTHVYK